jgi:hypothetical protein
MANQTPPKKKRRSAHQTQWAAQFAVASELIKREYEVAFTTGNHPQKDLMVISPGGVAFTVDVKGLYTKNAWVVRTRPTVKGLFYILAHVPTGLPNQFFILTQHEVDEGIRNNLSGWKSRKKAKGLAADESRYVDGFNWKYAVTFKEAWQKLPQ